MKDGREQDLAFVETVEKPFSVLLVMDVSGSMIDKADVLTQAAGSFLHSLRPDDTVAAATFNQEVHLLFNFARAEDIWKKDKKFKLRFDGLPPVTMVYDGWTLLSRGSKR